MMGKRVLGFLVLILFCTQAYCGTQSFDFTDGSWTPGKTQEIIDAGFTPNSGVVATTDLADLESKLDSGYYNKPTASLMAVYNDTQWVGAGTAMYLHSYNVPGSYPTATFGFGSNATSGSVDMILATGGRGDATKLELLSGGNVIGWVFMAKWGVQFSSDSSFYDHSLADVINPSDVGLALSTPIYQQYAQGLELSWEVGTDGMGGVLTATATYDNYSFGGNDLTKSESINFTANGVPDAFRIQHYYVDQSIGFKSIDITTVPEPASMVLISLGAVFLRRHKY